VRIAVNPEKAVSFPLKVRIPGWASGATTIHVNGQACVPSASGSFTRIERVWKEGDVIELRFPLVPRLSRGFNDSISIDRGALLFSYPIGEDWVKLRDRGMTADWQVFPSTPWNYGIAVSEEDADKIAVTESSLGASPFTLKNPGVTLRVEAKQIPSWLATDGAADVMPQSPVVSEEAKESISLVPYGAAKLRITAFPAIRS
jgi:hypothetical protein